MAPLFSMIRLHPYWSYHILIFGLLGKKCFRPPGRQSRTYVIIPRVAPSESLDWLGTRSEWFTLEEEVPMEDLERGYPQGMARYTRHTGILRVP